MSRLHRAVWVVALQLACSSEPSGRRGEVGVYDGGNAGASGSSGVGNPGGDGGRAGTVGTVDNALTVDVEDIAGMTIEIITLGCAGDCADIEAVAHGGHPPYDFAWEDGSTSPQRRVCLDASTGLTVSASDTAFDTEEFDYESQSASTDVTATVLDCTDAGAPPDDELCVNNPGFEGTLAPFAFEAPPWNNCIDQNPDIEGFPSTPDLADGSQQPGHGMTFASLGWASPLHEFITQELCAPLRAGHEYAFEVELSTASDALGAPYAPAQLAIYGSASDCQREELLWRSPPLDAAWTRHCVTLRPEHDAAFLTLEPTGEPAQMTFTWVDNIAPVASCR